MGFSVCPSPPPLEHPPANAPAAAAPDASIERRDIFDDIYAPPIYRVEVNVSIV
jgi:hypothetical protein